MIKPSFIPSPDIRQLRNLVRYRGKLTNILNGEKNRAQNCLTVSNLKLDDVFSDVFGKLARSITEYILEHPGEPFDVAPFVDKRCKHSLDEIQAAVDGAISHEQAVKLRESLDHMDELKKHRAKIEGEILSLTERHSPALDLLHSVPGFSANPMTAISIIAEIDADMSVFPSAKHLSSWAGCYPRNDQSGGKVRSTRISRAAPTLNHYWFRSPTPSFALKNTRSLGNVTAESKPVVGTKKPSFRVPYAPERYREYIDQAGALLSRWLPFSLSCG